MKPWTIIIVILVLAIVGTIGYGVYIFLIDVPEQKEPRVIIEADTREEILVAAEKAANKLVNETSTLCGIKLNRKVKWDYKEAVQSGVSTITLEYRDYKMQIDCGVATVAKTLMGGDSATSAITLGSKEMTRVIVYMASSEDSFAGGYITDSAVVSETEGAGMSYTVPTLDIGENKFTIRYFFSSEVDISDPTIKTEYDNALLEMDDIVESITLN
jgi:hypothetical protein